MGAAIQSPGGTAGSVPTPQLPAAARRTIHRILERLDRENLGLEVLHRDLFDSDPAVALSALAAVAAKKERRSLRLVVRLSTAQEEAVRTAAIAALARMGCPEAARVLWQLYKVSRSESTRRAALEALAELAPEAEELDTVLRQLAGSQVGSAGVRATAARLLVRLHGPDCAASLLESTGTRLVEPVYEALASDPSGRIAAHALQHWDDLDDQARSRAVSLAAPFAAPEALALLFKALEADSEQVRAAAYDAIGGEGQEGRVEAIAAFLAAHVDPSPILEEKALASIERLESLASAARPLSPGERNTIYARVQELYHRISAPERRVASESHELGWMIARSKEYLEYYADEDLRQAVVGFLKGSPNYSGEGLLQALKRSAVKVEVRHFEGYTALADLFKNPRRSGLGLIARELAIAKLGKRGPFYRLIRNIRLTRLFPPGAGSRLGAASLFNGIYEWSRQAKLYRLTEAALYALAKVDPEAAARRTQECLRPPVFSKICAIAAIRLIGELDWSVLEPAVLQLLAGPADAYVVLNLLDALANRSSAAAPQVTNAVLALLRSTDNPEIGERAGAFLAAQAPAELLEGICSCYEGSPAWKRATVLGVLERWVGEGRAAGHEGLVEFLYRVLNRGESGALRARVAALLWRLKDDYAADLLRSIAREGSAEERLEAVRALKGSLSSELVPFVRALLPLDNPAIQEALSDAVSAVEDEPLRVALRDLALGLCGEPGYEVSGSEGEADLEVNLLREKTTFRFEREYIQELAILFTDIQGYSRKAEALSSVDLAALLQEYEGILLPTMTSHRGELVKKMGDGHLFVFTSALDAVLAAIRLQKALKRFNSYREERSRVGVRIGVHWGKVIRRSGDVLGNNVNIASRLEGAAPVGSLLVSQAVHERLGGWVHCRELGAIQVKNISEPVKIYEPYEIALDLPKDRDPLSGEAAATSVAASAVAGGSVILDQEAIDYIGDTFARLAELCDKAERGEAGLGELRAELSRRWQRWRAALTPGEG